MSRPMKIVPTLLPVGGRWTNAKEQLAALFIRPDQRAVLELGRRPVYLIGKGRPAQVVQRPRRTVLLHHGAQPISRGVGGHPEFRKTRNGIVNCRKPNTSDPVSVSILLPNNVDVYSTRVNEFLTPNFKRWFSGRVGADTFGRNVRG